jgi:hypothetical protein
MEMKPTGSSSPYTPAFGLRDRLLARLQPSDGAQPGSTASSFGGTEAPNADTEAWKPQQTPPPAPLAGHVVNGCIAAESWLKQEVDYATRETSPLNQLKNQIRQFRLDMAADHMQRYIDDIESRGSPYDPDTHFSQGVDSNGWLVDNEPARVKAVGYKGYSSDDLRSGVYSTPEERAGGPAQP